MATVNEDLFETAVSHQIGLQRLSTGIVHKIVALLNRTDPDIENQVRKRLAGFADGSITFDDATRRRLEQVLAAIREINAEAYKTILARMTAELDAAGNYEADYQQRSITAAIPIQVDVVKPTAEQLQAIVVSQPFRGRILKDWADSLAQGRTARIADQLRIGLVEGETIDQLVSRLRGTRQNGYRDGILEISRRDAEAVVRTATNHVTTNARELLYNSNTDLVKGVRWVSTLDSRTTDICQARDGTVYPVNSGPRPPAHWNCRSTTSPVIKSWQELGIDMEDAPPGTRASMDGQVPADTTYQQWLKGRSFAEQSDILGPTRALLFRKGGLSLDRFVDDKGRTLTLDELRARDAGAFQTAGISTPAQPTVH